MTALRGSGPPQVPLEARIAPQIRTVQVLVGEVAIRMSPGDPDRLVLREAIRRLNRIQRVVEGGK